MTFASLRASVEGSTLISGKDYAIPYSTIPHLGKFIKGSVVGMTANQAVLDNGGDINFDYAIIATGASNRLGAFAQPQGDTISDRKAELQSTSARVKAAKSIIIVGAGATGIELAGEIVDHYAGKNVTLISSQSVLLQGEPKSVTDSVTQFLTKHNVTIKYNVKATVSADETCVTLSNGENLTADLVLNCVGSKPNTAWLESTPLASSLDASGRLIVDNVFRVKGFKNIFSIGDCSSIPDKKLGYYAHLEADHLAKNFKLLIKNPEAILKPYKPGGPVGFYNLGRGAGVGAMGSCVLPSFIVASVKSKDLFVSKTRGELGVK